MKPKNALWKMRSSNSPSPDGFELAFYKSFWPLVSDSVAGFLDSFHSGQAELDGINRAFVVLLPKKDDAVTPSDF